VASLKLKKYKGKRFIKLLKLDQHKTYLNNLKIFPEISAASTTKLKQLKLSGCF